MFIMTTVGVSLLSMVQRSLVVSFKAREQMTCSRMAQTGSARVKNIDFYYLFAADSAQADHGLQAAYPYRTVLDGLKATLGGARFDRFRIQVTFMRRDISDSNGDGLTSDLVPFRDDNGDSIDDIDSNIRFRDQNTDGDFTTPTRPEAAPSRSSPTRTSRRSSSTSSARAGWSAPRPSSCPWSSSRGTTTPRARPPSPC
jgi:hypothetical protein